MLFRAHRLTIRILIAGAAAVLAGLIAACGPISGEGSTSPAMTPTAGPDSSEPALEKARTPTQMATHGSTSAPASAPGPNQEPTPTPDIQRYVDLDLPEGDPLRGRNVAMRNGCRGCHYIKGYTFFALPFAETDDLPHILERGEMRIADPNYTGKATSNREYFFESVYLPELYVVSGQWLKAMPRDFNDRLTDEQDLADLLAWIAALNDPDFEFK